MVINEIIKIQISHILEIFYRMGDLEVVVIIMSAIKCFVQSIVCNTVQSLSIYPATVISMNYFAHQPEIRFDFFCSTAERTHEIKIQYIGSIQADSIYIKLRNPVTDHITAIILNFWISLV